MRQTLRNLAMAIAAIPLGLSAPAQAEDSVESREEHAQATAQPAHPALWKVADADTTIYLFGTIHILPGGIDWFNGPIAEAFGESGELVTEISAVEASKVSPATMSQMAALPEGESLRDMLGEHERAQLEAGLAELGLPPTFFDRNEPWYAAMMLSLLNIVRSGFNPEDGAEKLLEARATSSDMIQSGLETPQYQLGVFDSLPMDAQTRYLGEVIDQIPEIRQTVLDMVEAWKAGDAETLATLMNAGESDPALAEALLTGRNRAWADWIKTRLDAPGTVFVAVGAGHLAGQGSVQQQLCARGISTQRVQ